MGGMASFDADIFFASSASCFSLLCCGATRPAEITSLAAVVDGHVEQDHILGRHEHDEASRGVGRVRHEHGHQLAVAELFLDLAGGSPDTNTTA